ncbi:MAG TPA: LCP family protein [Anaerolineales bacterium]|nr:LCP family protein [Anaerolineales bacterium]
MTWLWLFPPPPTNILLIGLDQRPGESVASRTDSLILTRVDLEKNHLVLVGIPRDLWVVLPDGSQNRINTAHYFAELNESGSGPLAAVDTVSANFGLTLHYYVRVNFDGFRALIDSIGGIEINIEKRIYDDLYPTDDYGYQTIVFEPGLQTLNGEQALQYARTRHGSSDFERAKRQQQVIAAFISRLYKPTTWFRLPAIWAAFQSAIQTNLSPLMLAKVAYATMRLGTENIERVVLEPPMVQGFITDAGASVQLPQWQQINPVLLELFGE